MQRLLNYAMPAFWKEVGSLQSFNGPTTPFFANYYIVMIGSNEAVAKELWRVEIISFVT